MKILVLNGSPKGRNSVTMQYVRYLRENQAGDEWTVLDLAANSHSFISDTPARQNLLQSIAGCDAVLWAFPLYHMSVSSQYMTVINSLFQADPGLFRGRYAAALSTSIHFFDHTAHNYIRAVSEDLGMTFTMSFSAAMMDLMNPAVRKNLLSFGRQFVNMVNSHAVLPALTAQAHFKPWSYSPGAYQGAPVIHGKKAVIIADIDPAFPNVQASVNHIQTVMGTGTRVIDLNSINIKGGCLGCCSCGPDNICAYDGSDGFRVFFEDAVKDSDIIIMAGAIHRRFLSPRWKQFFDRSFYNTHQPYFRGKQVAWMISGPLAQNANLRQILESYPDFMEGNLAGIVTDECADSALLDQAIENLAARIRQSAADGYIAPITFLGLGGKRVFRDEIYQNLRALFQGDHRYYKKHRFYDFPTRNVLMNILQPLLMLVTAIPAVRRKMPHYVKNGMIAPFQHLFNDQEA